MEYKSRRYAYKSWSTWNSNQKHYKQNDYSDNDSENDDEHNEKGRGNLITLAYTQSPAMTTRRLLWLCKKLKFDHTTKWYVQKPESAYVNEIHKILRDFEV